MKASDNPYPSLLVQEMANDGSDFTNPAADFRRFFIGEDGALHLKDSAGTVTTIASATTTKLDDLATPDDNTDLNATTGVHGLLPKLGGGTTNFLRADGTWATPPGSGGDVATDAIWDAAGDIAIGTGSNTAAKLTIGASGTVPKSNGTTLAYALPPGHEYDYVEFTSTVNVTQTVEASADTIVTAGAVTFDGSTLALIEFFAPSSRPNGSSGAVLRLWLFDGSSSIGRIGGVASQAATNGGWPLHLSHRLTPSAASHTYSIRATVDTGTGNVQAGTGGSGTLMPGFIRITKAT